MRREAMDRSGEVMDEKRMRWMDEGVRVGRLNERRRRMEVKRRDDCSLNDCQTTTYFNARPFEFYSFQANE